MRTRRVARYDATQGALVVPLPERQALIAAARLQVQGGSGMARLGVAVRALVRRLGGERAPGHPPTLRAVLGRVEQARKRGRKREPRKTIFEKSIKSRV